MFTFTTDGIVVENIILYKYVYELFYSHKYNKNKIWLFHLPNIRGYYIT